MAEAIASGILKGAGVKVASAGLSAYNGAAASTHAAACMEHLGLSLSGHRARTIDDQLMDVADLILTMTTGHKNYLQQQYPHVAFKIYTLNEYVGEDGEVTDPFGQSLEVYEQCASDLQRLISKLAIRLQTGQGR
jgi:protein-tyrosine-phosphatase